MTLSHCRIASYVLFRIRFCFVVSIFRAGKKFLIESVSHSVFSHTIYTLFSIRYNFEMQI